jgi:hypothetical protein
MSSEEFFSEEQNKNFAFFQGHLHEYLGNELLKNKFVIIYDEKMVGTYDTFASALDEAASKYPQSEFIIQQIISNDEFIGFLRAAM